MKNKTIVLTAVLVLLVINLFSIASALSLRDVSVSPSEVAPGEKTELSFSVKNSFDDDIKNVQIALLLIANPSLGISESAFAASSSSVVSFDEISSEKSKTASFDLIAKPDSDAGVYSIPVLVSYTSNNVPKQEMFSVSATINAKPVFVLSQETRLMQNQKNTISIKITNTGLAKAKFLEVELGSGNYDLITGDKVYIGDLNSDDYDTASFDIFTRTSSLISFPVTLRYRDSTNQQYTESFAVTSKVYSRDEAIKIGLIQKSRTELYIGIIILLIVVYLVYRWIKKRRKRKLKEMGR